MASAQVMRKQEHLEAGKRRLEEFRKKKAAERAKKTASTTHVHAPDVIPCEKKLSETELVRQTSPDGAISSDGPVKVDIEPASVPITDNGAIDFSHKREQSSSNDILTNPLQSTSDYNIISEGEMQTHASSQELQRQAREFSGPVNSSHGQESEHMSNDNLRYSGGQGEPPYGITSEQSIGLRSKITQAFDSVSSQSSYYRMEESQSKGRNNSLLDSTVSNASISRGFATEISSQNVGNALLQTKPDSGIISASGRTISFHEDSVQPTTNMREFTEVGQNMYSSKELKDPFTFNMGDKLLGNSSSGLPSLNIKSTDISSDVKSSQITEINSRKSRPSFLDSLVPRGSSGSLFQRTETEESSMPNGFKYSSNEDLVSSAFQKSTSETSGLFSKPRIPNPPSASENSANFSVSTGHADDLKMPSDNNNIMETKQDFYSSKQNEDFSALEQHIEDLTQEKFSLQRALDASRVLSESLAAENSSLTDSYNQQRSVVNQLHSDMERLQEEIKAQLVELESFKLEYANAQLECNAADERSKLLASEVIGLEEKALKLRSNELKLERQLENSYAEISSCKKKMSSLERERQDLQMTIDALQEEKKLLQSKLRKASKSEKSIDVSKTAGTNKDMSTSTEDLEYSGTVSDTSNQEIPENAAPSMTDAPDFPMVPGNGQLNLEDVSVNLPPDQMSMILNINQLLSELAMEKEELIQALTAKSSESSRLKDLNKELSRKLETQTQRLELLTAQSMASDNVTARLPDAHAPQEDTAYADEGDEVVERVLGWIMKLFPGGPSKRRTSKLL